MESTERKPSKRPSLGDLTGMAPPTPSLARDTVAQLERLGTGQAAAHPAAIAPSLPATREVPDARLRAEPAGPAGRRNGRGRAPSRWSEADLKRALLEDAEVESVWVKFATQVKIETRERLNAFVLHGKRKRFNSTRIQDVVDAALSRYLDEQGFGREDAPREAA